MPSVKLFDVGQEAHGVMAIGQAATGVVAFGQVATGVIAIGQLARGVVAVGQMAIGVVAIGQVGVGIVYGAGMFGVGAAAGGILPLGVIGRLGLGDLRRAKFAGFERRSRLGPLSALVMLALVALVWAASLGPLQRELFEIGGILHVPG